jgi:glycosyltransferase 2 family protein
MFGKPTQAAPDPTDRLELAGLEAIPPLPPKRKLRRYLFVLAVLGFAIYFFLSRFAAMERATFALSNLKISFAVLSVGSEVLSYLGSRYLLRTAVRLAGKPVSVIDGALMTAGANSVGTLGGGVLGTAGMTYYWLRRRGINSGAAGLGGWLPIISDNIVLAVLSLAGFLVMIHRGKSTHIFAAGFVLAVLLLLGSLLAMLTWSIIHRDKLEPLATGIGSFAGRLRHRPSDALKVKAAVNRFLEGWDALLRGGWRGPALGAILNASFDMLTLGLTFLAAGYRISPAVLVAGYGLPQLLGKLTIVLGGVRVVEASMIGLYSVLGAPRQIAVVAVLAYRLASFWLPTLIGVVLIPYLESRMMPSAQTEKTAGPVR